MSILKITGQRKMNAAQGVTPSTGACFCIGKQNGEPFCPCMMRQKEQEKCVFDALPEDMKNQPLHLACFCPKCTPR